MDVLQSLFSIDFQGILTFVLIYLGIIWVLVSVWVFSDAKKRYDSMLLTIALFLVVLVFNFPALIFYLIIRPEHEDEHVFYFHGNNEMQEYPGVNVPIVNFVGKDGFKISLNMNIGNPENAVNSALDVNVDWKSDDANMKISETKKAVVVTSPKVAEAVSATTQKASDRFKDVRSKFSSAFKRKPKVVDIGKVEEAAKTEDKKVEDKKVEDKKEEATQKDSPSKSPDGGEKKGEEKKEA